jgi:hypothetical protein
LQVLRNRVLLANRLAIKRLVMERILYSEIGALQEKYKEVKHDHFARNAGENFTLELGPDFWRGCAYGTT